MRHNLSVYWAIARARIRSAMQYKINFLLGIATLLLDYSAQFLNLNLLLWRFENLKGWNAPELVFMLTLAILSWGFCIVFFWSFRFTGEFIRSGEFDRFLIRPASPFFQMAGARFGTMAFGQFLFSILAFWWVTQQLDIAWSPRFWLVLAGVALGGALIQGAAVMFVGVAAFWTTQSDSLYWAIVYPARQLTWYPLNLFPRALQILLTFVVPFGFINFYPAHNMLGKSAGLLSSPWFPWLTPLVGLIFFGLAAGLWSVGLRRYHSTGS